LACPFFVPTEKWDGGGWLHPARLPLGGGWQGHCSAPGHEQAQLAETELREFCNLGYATKCAHLPKEREFDAVRFIISGEQGQRLLVSYVGEAGHLPVTQGQLEYDLLTMHWTSQHADPRIQRQVECYVQAYLQRRIPRSNS
jgi:hypothetical protein